MRSNPDLGKLSDLAVRLFSSPVEAAGGRLAVLSSTVVEVVEVFCLESLVPMVCCERPDWWLE